MEFEKVDIRVGTIISVEALPDAHIPAWVLQIDFGSDVGIKKSSARIAKLYNETDLLGRQILAVVNLEPRQIGKIISECLVLGLPKTTEKDAEVVLIQPEREVPNGLKLS